MTSVIKGLLGIQDQKLWDGVGSKTFKRPNSSGGQSILNKIGNTVDALHVYGDGADYSGATINKALAAIGPNTVGLLLAPGSWALAVNVTIPSNVVLIVSPGAILTIDSGVTLTINGQLDAGLYQIFSNSGTVTLNGNIPIAYPEWWGKNTTPGTTDMTDAINDALSSETITTRLQPETYLISSTLLMTAWKNLHGSGNSTQLEMSSSTYTADYGILFNSTDGAAATEATSQVPAGSIRDMQIITGSGEAKKGIFFSGSIFIDNIKFQYAEQAIVGIDSESDVVKISNINLGAIDAGSDYQIEITGYGDIRIDGVVCENETGPDASDSIKITQARSGSITNSEGDNVYLDRCDAFTVSNWLSNGSDPGVFSIRGCNLTLRDSRFARTKSGQIAPILGVTGYNGNVIMENVTFVDYMDDETGIATTYDVKTALALQWQFVNCQRLITTTDDSILRTNTGITLCDQSQSAIDDFNNYSYMLSSNGIIRANGEVNRAGYWPALETTGEATSDVTESEIEWGESTGTYYYRAQLLLDGDRACGAGGAGGERSIALTNGGVGARIGIDFEEGICRLYRGTSAGSYTKYVDIHLRGGTYFYDTGDRISGWTWSARGAAGVDTLFAITGLGLRKGNVFVEAISTAPGVGTWADGDRVENVAPAAGDYIGLVCTTAGSPGTWKDFGVISA